MVSILMQDVFVPHLQYFRSPATSHRSRDILIFLVEVR